MHPTLSKSSTSLASQGRHNHHHHHHHLTNPSHHHHSHLPHHSQPHLRHHPLQIEQDRHHYHHQQQQQQHQQHQRHQQLRQETSVDRLHHHYHHHPPPPSNNSSNSINNSNNNNNNNNNNSNSHHQQTPEMADNNLYSNVAVSNDGSLYLHHPCQHQHHNHHHHHHLAAHYQTHLHTLPHRSSQDNPLPSPPHLSQHHHQQHQQQQHQHHHQQQEPHHHHHHYEYSSSDNDFHDITSDAFPEPIHVQAHVHSSASDTTHRSATPASQSPKEVATSSALVATTAPATDERRTENDVYDNVDYDLVLSSCCCKSCCCRCCSESCSRQCAYRCGKGMTKFTRFFLIIPNLLFVIFGSAMIGMAAWIRSERESYFYAEILNRMPVGPLLTFDKLPVVIIAVGSCILVLSFLACCGACAESICFLYLYTTFLLFIMVAEVTLGVMMSLMREQIQTKLEVTMQNQIKYDYNSTETSLFVTSSLSDQSGVQESGNMAYVQHMTMAWDRLQIQFGCCGSVDPGDYYYSLWYNRSNHATTKVPPSCCFPLDDNSDSTWPPELGHWLKEFQSCQSEAAAYQKNKKDGFSPSKEGSSFLKTQGCKEALVTLLEKNVTILIVAVVVIVVLQILDFILACALMKYFRRKMENSNWYEDDDID